MNITDRKSIARISGLLYLAVIIFGVFAEVMVRGKMLVSGDAAATVAKVSANPVLFRLGFVSDLLMITAFFFLPLALYRLLHTIHKDYAALMVLCVMVCVAIMSVNMLNHLAILLILPGQAASLDPGQAKQLVLLFGELHKNGYRIAQIFFGLWLWPLGVLVIRSGFIPRIFGWLLIAATISFLLDFFLFFLLPDYTVDASSLVTLPTVIGEFAFCGWLLIKGVR